MADSFYKELKIYGLNIRHSDAPDRKKVDFTIEDKEDNVCWVWGDTPSDVEWECSHPVVKFGDVDELGECKVCGSHCEWHYEEDDEGHKVRTPHEWYSLPQPRGLLGQILEILKILNGDQS